MADVGLALHARRPIQCQFEVGREFSDKMKTAVYS